MAEPVGIIAMLPVLMMLLLGGGGGFPLGIPPLPEDPMLSRIAPDDCLVYVNSSGMATPEAKSKNQTEQLLAEPEVQRLVSEIERGDRGPGRPGRPAGAGGTISRTPSAGAETAHPARGGVCLIDRHRHGRRTCPRRPDRRHGR